MQGNYDEQFRIRTAVPEFEAYLKRYRELSAETRRRLRSSLDCSYGPSTLERVDVFLPDSDGSERPVNVFFHGGYWRTFDKSDYSYVAQPVVEANAVAVIANYGLMPSVTMAELLAHCHTVIHWVHTNASRFGASPNRISLSGHSAGAHIAVLLGLTNWEARGLPPDVIRSVTAVSGIYDLAPVMQSFLRQETKLTQKDVSDFSPITCIERAPYSIADFLIAYGTNETEEFQRQSEVLCEVLRKRQMNVEQRRVNDRNHMSIVLDLGDAESILCQTRVIKLKA